jgi:hypothetical protein
VLTWPCIFVNINPFSLAALGVTFALGFSILGAGWYVASALL